jgi:hypothetical protein
MYNKCSDIPPLTGLLAICSSNYQAILACINIERLRMLQEKLGLSRRTGIRFPHPPHAFLANLGGPCTKAEEPGAEAKLAELHGCSVIVAMVTSEECGFRRLRC